jgi:integrase/recombinase XerD
MGKVQRRLNKGLLRQVIARLGEKAGVAHAHPHRFRHTFAITYLRSWDDVLTLQALLWHRTLKMAQHYARIAQLDLEQIHRKASPVDIWNL